MRGLRRRRRRGGCGREHVYERSAESRMVRRLRSACRGNGERRTRAASEEVGTRYVHVLLDYDRRARVDQARSAGRRMIYTMTTPCDECPFLKFMAHGFTIRQLEGFASGEFGC